MQPWQYQEEWAEREAVHCIRMLATMNEQSAQWARKHDYKMALECQIRGDVWRQMADSLRQPKRIRLEREAMENEP